MTIHYFPCWVEEYAYVARIIGTAQKGVLGSAVWVEVWNGSRWTHLEFKTPGLYNLWDITPLAPSEVQALGIPADPFPFGYDVPEQVERD